MNNSHYNSYVHVIYNPLQEMLERQLEYERVRLEAESRKACLESQEKVGRFDLHCITQTLAVPCQICLKMERFLTGS